MKKLLRKWRRWRAGRRLAKVINDHHTAYRIGHEDGHKKGHNAGHRCGWEAGNAAGWSNLRHYISDKEL